MPLLEDLDTSKHNATLTAARALLVLAGTLVGANARDVHSSVSVSATVMAVARLELQSAPAMVDISAADLARGFVDVREPTALVVRSNSPNGFVLELVTVSPMVSSVVVQGFGPEQIVGADGGTIVQRWQSPHVVNLSLRFRLVLAPGLAAGPYPWPMRLSVRPLDTA